MFFFFFLFLLLFQRTQVKKPSKNNRWRLTANPLDLGFSSAWSLGAGCKSPSELLLVVTEAPASGVRNRGVQARRLTNEETESQPTSVKEQSMSTKSTVVHVSAGSDCRALDPEPTTAECGRGRGPQPH